MGAGEALRRVLECLASGILLAGLDNMLFKQFFNLMFFFLSVCVSTVVFYDRRNTHLSQLAGYVC